VTGTLAIQVLLARSHLVRHRRRARAIRRLRFGQKGNPPRALQAQHCVLTAEHERDRHCELIAVGNIPLAAHAQIEA
jgi:hypothetical protein